jgi:hypothetical protein
MHRTIGAMLLAVVAPSSNASAQPSLDRFRTCLSIEDMTKERLDCFDAIVPPEPRAVTMKPAAISDCRFHREQDERLICHNGFLVARAPSAPRPPAAPTSQRIPNERFRPCHAMQDMTRERLDCFDAIIRPEPRQAFTAQPQSIFECKYFREQDHRLRCYLNFTARIFKAVQRAVPAPAPPPRTQLLCAKNRCESRAADADRAAARAIGRKAANARAASGDVNQGVNFRLDRSYSSAAASPRNRLRRCGCGAGARRLSSARSTSPTRSSVGRGTARRGV